MARAISFESFLNITISGCRKLSCLPGGNGGIADGIHLGIEYNSPSIVGLSIDAYKELIRPSIKAKKSMEKAGIEPKILQANNLTAPSPQKRQKKKFF
jgi:hypothetical protein